MNTSNNMKTYVVMSILLSFSFYLLPVKAANLTVQSTSSYLYFDDTDEVGIEWRLVGNEATFALYNYDTSQYPLWFTDTADMQLEMLATTFQIEDEAGNPIVNVHRDAPLSLDIQADGDVSLAGGDVFIDTSTNRLGIGTTTPGAAIHLSAATPQILFDDFNEGGVEWLMNADQNNFYLLNYDTSKTLLWFDDLADMQLNMNALTFQIEDEANNTIVNVHRNAPFSLDIQDNGDVSLAGGDVFIDTSLNRLGIGTTAPDAAIHLSAAVPRILFDDSDEVGWEWLMHADQNSFSLYNYDTDQYLLYFDDLADMQLEMRAASFQIEDEADNPIVNVHRDAPLSLNILGNGDMSLAGGDVYIDTSTNRVGIGTNIPVSDLEIQSLAPGIHFDDTSASSADWFVGNEANDLVFKTQDNATGGPAATRIMTLDAQTGYIGMNKDTPTAALHVGSPDNVSAKVLVENPTAVVATRTLFELQNPGRTHFKITNTDANTQWVFTNTGPAFFISLQGTGGPEFKIQNNGNATLAGTLTQGSDVNAKTAFTAIDAYEILDLVSKLPVSKWEYKDARGEAHIGPMAQDFYAAFGLGGSETGISSIDTGGVALAAIKALHEKNNSLEKQNADLLARLEELERQQAGIQVMMATLIEAQQAAPVLTKTAMN